MKQFFNLITLFVIVGLFGLSLYSCEEENNEVGGEIIGDGSLGNTSTIDLLTYNTNLDSLRSDDNVLQSAILGVYNDNIFGSTKANFITQVRLPVTNPTFNEEAIVDSVILRIPIYFDPDPDVNPTGSDTIILYDDPDDEGLDTLLIRSRYLTDSIYGNSNNQFTLQVKEVNEFLYGRDTAYYSNPTLRERDNISTLPNILGTVEVGAAVITNNVRIRLDGFPDAFSEVPAYKIFLDTNYFQEKIINQEGSADLGDIASFIRNVINGIEISAQGEEGFLFGFNPNALDLRMHYSFKNPNDDNQNGIHDDDEDGENDPDEPREVSLRSSTSILFNTRSTFGGSFNVHVGQFVNNSNGTPFQTALNNSNPDSGDSRIFLNGLDGTRARVRINQEQLNNFKQEANNNIWPIMSAYIRFYIDDSFSLPKPEFLYAWHEYEDQDNQNQSELFSDLTSFVNSYPNNVQFNRRYDFENDSEYFQINITEYIKEIVEQNLEYNQSELVLAMGNFLIGSSGTPLSINPFVGNRAFNPYRIVLHGNTSEQVEKRPKLTIQYATNN